MAIIVRIDVDRPFGRQPVLRHVLSRVSSDLYFPRVQAFGYLRELADVLGILENSCVRAHVFFRRCTLPSASLLRQLERGGHQIGLHLENSRSRDCFVQEKGLLEQHVGREVRIVSKHGSGGRKYGRTHFAPYEPEKYIEWAQALGMSAFLGNLEDPTISAFATASGLRVFPSAFWLEPSWRDTVRFSIEWLISAASKDDIVVLLHPENVLADPVLSSDLVRLVRAVETRVL